MQGPEPLPLTERKREHRNALKDKEYAAKKAVVRIKTEIDRIEAYYLAKSVFEAAKADFKKRNAEMALLMDEDERVIRLRAELEQAEKEHHEADKALSEMNYFQRERTIEATRVYRDVTEELGRQIQAFAAAAEIFAEAKGLRRPATAGAPRRAG